MLELDQLFDSALGAHGKVILLAGSLKTVDRVIRCFGALSCQRSPSVTF